MVVTLLIIIVIALVDMGEHFAVKSLVIYVYLFNINLSRFPCQDTQLCERIVCQNNGVCAIRSKNGPTESICLCRYGTSGDYCQLNGKKCQLSQISCILKNKIRNVGFLYTWFMYE
jgi:hypothetical protein